MSGRVRDRDNRITLLVGPNGSGKTQVLVEMLDKYVHGRRSRSSLASGIEIEGVGEPSRVVAQTFSPFSRFPRENTKPLTLQEYLEPSPGPYAAIGLTRGNGIGRPIAREVTGRILKRLYANPLEAPSFAVALTSMGFLPRLTLVYATTPLARKIEFESDGWELHDSVNRYLMGVQGDAEFLPQELPLRREVAPADKSISPAEARERLVELLVDSISQVKETSFNHLNRRDQSYTLAVDLRRDDASARQLHAFLVLSRTGFLRIRNCYLEPVSAEERTWQIALGTEKEFDITDASSGQQQTLSSLFGIAAEVEDDSLLLIDEPELSLHPAWQSSYLDNLRGVLSSRKGCDVFIATHSPLIAQRARELGLEMINLAKDEASPDVSHAEVSRTEASVDQILLDDFRVAVRDSTYVAHHLLSLVMKAEREAEKGRHADDVMGRLLFLQGLYNTSSTPDSKIDKLIADAISIVSTANNRDRG